MVKMRGATSYVSEVLGGVIGKIAESTEARVRVEQVMLGISYALPDVWYIVDHQNIRESLLPVEIEWLEDNICAGLIIVECR